MLDLQFLVRTAALAAILCTAMLSTAGAAEDAGADMVGLDDFVPDELIVGFHNVPAAARLAGLRQQVPAIVGWRAINHAPHPKNDPDGVHPLAKVRVAALAAGSDVPGISNQLRAMAGVRYAHPNYLTKIAFDPNDPMYSNQYGPQIVEAPGAWDITLGDASIVICVADTGFNYNHEDLQGGTIWVNPGEIPGNGQDDDNNGYIDDVNGWDAINDDNGNADSAGHGSHVTGIAAARINNATGIAGMANVTVMPVQVFNGGGGTWEAIAEAVYYGTDNGASALNYSGGGGSGDGMLADAVQYAWDNGMTVVAAAGNGNTSSPFYPASYPTVLAISGTDSNDQRYTSSNFGNHIDVAAPGVSVLSCWWNGATDYNTITGTSMSSPHVCGLVALMYTVNPFLTPQEVRDLLRDNADDLGDPGFDVFFGYGRINAAVTVAAVPSASLGINFPNGLPDIVGPNESTTILVEITEFAETIEPGTEKIFQRTVAAGTFQESLMTPLGGGLYEATLQAVPCGTAIEFYFSVESTQGTLVQSPAGAPGDFYSADSGTITVIVDDDFETDSGWTAENLGATSGDWQRGVPVNDPGWDYDPTSDSDGSGQCWLTQNQFGNTDVDDGAVRLTSSTIDMSAGNVLISYDYYLRLTEPGPDLLLVEINSNDGAGAWTEIASHSTNGGLSWRTHVIDQADLDTAGVVLTSTMKLRFTANDANPQSINESGLDALLVQALGCENDCPWDLDDDTNVGVSDLLVLLAAWGANPGHPGDLDGDDIVGVSDLLILLANWGPCP